MGEPPQPRAAGLSAELLDVAQEAARMAGALLRERFEAGREAHVSSKSSPTDPVSDADLASQRAIRELLERRRPDDGLLAEEEGARETGSSGLRWVVDPLDGTVNFLYGIPQWCVSIAVSDDLGTLAGVVHDPLAQETFTAVRGGPSARNGIELASRADDRLPLEQALIATGFAYDAPTREAQGKIVARLLPAVRDIRRFGSCALDLAHTAAGRFDGFYEHDREPWDTAAGVLICRGVGLEVRDLTRGVLVATPLIADAFVALADGFAD